MDDLRELYQATILEHNKRPRNFAKLEHPTHEADGHNPLCGDALTLYARVDGNGRLADVAFQGSGCAISKASASLMTEHVKGKTVDEVQADFERFHALLTAAPDVVPSTDGLGKLAVFSGVREYPVRVKCATLAWHALKAALEARGETAKTE
ncbi:SUF system NifU family Fe-S cluster assembly protein [Myxococcota bacterium]|nr:SUF system NifU family Fe-S cluster assembly protein [Myxococcota bacterium]